MVKDIRYIIKRIIVGVGIALILSFLRGNLLLGVSAKEISSVWMPFSSHVVVVDNLDNTLQFTPSNNGHWANWGFGYLRFNFSIIKVDGSSTSPLVVPNNVSVNNYVCDVSSTSSSNSTFTGATYSATCPMIMGPTGLGNMYILLTDNQQNSLSNYRVTVGGLVTFEKVDDVTLDTSTTTNAINNQITNDNSNTQSIINNNNSNTQSIINNQNSNTQQQIESQKVCKFIDKNSIIFEKNYLNNNGVLTYVNSSTGVTDFINIKNSTIKQLTGYNSNLAHFCFYDVNKTKISCFSNNVSYNNTFLTIPNNANYFRTSISSDQNKPTFEICQNGNQAIVDSQQDINNTLNDSSVSDPDINNMSSKLASNNSITQLLTLPITLFQNILNNINGSCSSYNLGSLYGTSLVLPCINLETILGSTLWGIIDILISGLFILSFRKKMVDIFNNMSSLKDRGNELE